MNGKDEPTGIAVSGEPMHEEAAVNLAAGKPWMIAGGGQEAAAVAAGEAVICSQSSASGLDAAEVECGVRKAASKRVPRLAPEMGNPRSGSKTKNGGVDSELHAAARAGDLVAVESICSSNPLAVNSRDKHSRTPLHLAAWCGHAETVSYLCKRKADVGASAMDDTAAIHFASQKGHTEAVRVLLSSGASIKSSNRKGMTALHFAAQGSHLELVKYLIRKGADLGSKNKSGEAPLDLIKSEEMRALAVEYEQSLKNRDQTMASKTDEDEDGFPLDPSNAEDGTDVGADDSSREQADDDNGIEREKRRGEEEDGAQVSLPDAKKAKVSLGHLLAEDDPEEEEI